MRRAGSLFLCLVLSSSSLFAAAPEIPSKYLDADARIRAGMSQQIRHRMFAIVDRTRASMSVADVRALTRGESAETSFLVMLEYLKMLQKEARLDGPKMGDHKTPPGKRFEDALTAANLSFLLGAVGPAPGGGPSFPLITPTPTPRPPLLKKKTA